jgi:hypothetical protein
MLKAKEDDREASIATAKDKKEQAKVKKAKGTDIMVTVGAHLLKRIERHGPSEINRFKVDELHALLVRTYPQGVVPEPSKNKGGIEKVNQLKTMKNILRRHALASDVAAISPMALGPTVLLDMVNRGSFGSFVASCEIFPHSHIQNNVTIVQASVDAVVPGSVPDKCFTVYFQTPCKHAKIHTKTNTPIKKNCTTHP